MALILSGSDNTVRKTDNTAGVRIGNKVAFHAYRNGGHVAANGASDVLVVCETIRFNYGGCYHPTTGRFTATKAGTYYFSGNGMNTSSAAGDHQLSIRKNGSRYNTSNPGQSSGGYGIAVYWTVSVMQLAVGDYVDLVYYSSNTGQSLYANSWTWNHFTGYMVG